MKKHLIKLQNLLNRREFILEGSPMSSKNVSKHLIIQPFLNPTDTMTVINPTNLKNVAKVLIKDHPRLSIRVFVLERSHASVKNVSQPLIIAQPFLNVSDFIAVTEQKAHLIINASYFVLETNPTSVKNMPNP
ncbi:Hypothetical predicted protein [Marmota monax]|uniref:Uncharacterized protein n=1 Tax=Marmota monax TaxID=9995 RepID=A0A5E4D6D9_MARMO|nr:hypothetical protein GHT09_017191 [Marmota monax]VTJ89588.1 Hypothetical predicted protein [Marmota monax]